MGAVPVQLASPELGAVEDRVIIYPVTATSSNAVKEVMGMSRLVEGEVAEKLTTIGSGDVSSLVIVPTP